MPLTTCIRRVAESRSPAWVRTSRPSRSGMTSPRKPSSSSSWTESRISAAGWYSKSKVHTPNVPRSLPSMPPTGTTSSWVRMTYRSIAELRYDCDRSDREHPAPAVLERPAEGGDELGDALLVALVVGPLADPGGPHQAGPLQLGQVRRHRRLGQPDPGLDVAHAHPDLDRVGDGPVQHEVPLRL